VECSPLCSLEWLVGGEVVTGEEGQFRVEEEQLEGDRDQFPSILSSLTWLKLDRTDGNTTVACRC
jgi:hypothetical protein